MQKFFLKCFATAILCVALTPAIKAQVTIGSTEAPVKGSILQTKTIPDAAPVDSAGGISAYQGVVLPRVNLVDRKKLIPMYDYQTNIPTYTEEQIHRGLIVYNMRTDTLADLAPGIYCWDGFEWYSFQKGEQNAIFEIDCNAIDVRGEYGSGKSLDGTNFLRLNIVNVIRTGYYSITITSLPDDNGFFFEQSGNFYTTGNMTITIPGIGEPIRSGTTHFKINISGGQSNCEFDISVTDLSIQPKFSMICNATEVFGTYYEDSVMNSTNYMEIHLTVDPSAFGATAKFNTNEVDGISFGGSAILTSNPQTVRLQASGKPYGLNDKTFHIISNSITDPSNCRHTVYMSLPMKRIMTTGTFSYYNYNIGLLPYNANYSRSPNAMLTDKDNFGPYQHSILRFKGFSNKGNAVYSVSTSQENVVQDANETDDGRDIVAVLGAKMTGTASDDMTAARLGSWLRGKNGQPPIDILYLGGYTYEWCPSNAEGQAKADTIIAFLRRGGIVIIACELPTTSGNFFNRLFYGTNISTTDGPIGSAYGLAAGTLYNFGYTSHNVSIDEMPYFAKNDDPILTGPFENIVGRCWGEDASTTVYLTNLPLDSVVVYSSARPANATLTSNSGIPHNSATIFRHVNLPLIYIGDGGFNSAGLKSEGEGGTICPFDITTKVINGHTYTHYPTYRNFGNFAPNRAYNAVFLANAIAWCLYQAEENRRNNR